MIVDTREKELDSTKFRVDAKAGLLSVTFSLKVFSIEHKRMIEYQVLKFPRYLFTIKKNSSDCINAFLDYIIFRQCAYWNDVGDLLSKDNIFTFDCLLKYLDNWVGKNAEIDLEIISFLKKIADLTVLKNEYFKLLLNEYYIVHLGTSHIIRKYSQSELKIFLDIMNKDFDSLFLQLEEYRIEKILK